MDIDKVTVCSPTKAFSMWDTPFGDSLNMLSDFAFYSSFAYENKEPLPVVYNRAIDEALEDDSDCLILVHDDVTLEHNPIPKLKVLFDQFDLVGVAGTTQCEIKAPALWHLMGGGFQGGNLRGAVAHSQGNQKQMSSFGPYPARVVMIDGLFMALSKKLLRSGVRFDETNPAGFHFYDLSFSLDVGNAGLKVGVGDIYLSHASPGLSSYTPEFLAGQDWFINKYGN